MTTSQIFNNVYNRKDIFETKKSFKDAILSKIDLDPNISKKLATLNKLKEVQDYHKNFNFEIDNTPKE